MGPLVRPFCHFARRTSKIFRLISYFLVTPWGPGLAAFLAARPRFPFDERL
jgi:hypothetical protein